MTEPTEHAADGAVTAEHDGEPEDSRTDQGEVTDDRSTPARPWAGRGVAFWAGWALAAVGLVAAGVLGVLLLDARATEGERDAVAEAAGTFALTLTSWDASEGMATTREELRAASTESFAAEVDELFGGTDDLRELEEIGARSVSEVDETLVERIDGDRAEALVVVVQRVTTEVTEGEEVSLRYARLGLERQDGTWRVDRVELLVDLLQEAAERRADTPTPGGVELDDDPDELDDDAEEPTS